MNCFFNRVAVVVVAVAVAVVVVGIICLGKQLAPILMMSGSGSRAQTTKIGGTSDSTVTTAISPMQMSN